MAKQYDEQFKRNALRYRQDHPELSVAAVRRNLGISVATFYKWQQSANQNDGEINHRSSENMESDEAKEITRLRRELKNRDDALMILKKAMGILAKDEQK